MRLVAVILLLVLCADVFTNAFPFVQFCNSDIDCRWNGYGQRFCLGWECERYYQMTPCSKDSDCVGRRGGKYCRNMYCRSSRMWR